MDETLLMTVRYLQGTNQPTVQTQRVKNGGYVSIQIKHLNIRVTWNPGTKDIKRLVERTMYSDRLSHMPDFDTRNLTP